ncbi:MAG TPA: PilC/PilY family type IV pilus protein, partial [Rhodocyclaceae bacterium]|nr:PilC/PilY family type IV pilus protein [Rhodocyclaceae bacterium]
AWCVETVQPTTCTAPSTIVADSSDEALVYYCVTPDATAASCPSPGILDGTNCKVEIAAACTGSLPGRVSTASDTRTIYKNDGAGGLQDFVYANLNPLDFTATGLSQWSVYDASQKTAAAGANLVNYLRGQTGYEDRGSNPVANRLYRFREAVMGDALESEPTFIAKPVFSYTDPGYADFKTTYASRAGTVYMGTNAGMLHAFDATTGSERWAYVPSVVIPNLWKLADINYATNHQNFFNGSPVVTDICTANCSCNEACVAGGGAAPVWKTILVSGLNAGGRSYFALDVTDPTAPSLLWEITSASVGFSNLGYSFGKPVVTKKSDGTWVVLFTSGYNNTTPGDGQGYLFVVNAATGALISAISTGVGDTTTPSGLAKISAWNDFGGVDNTAGPVYGGDLQGNVWRFNINTAAAPFKLATLKDASNNAQPITTTPVLGKISGKRVIMIGTGKYLEIADLTDTSQQSVYAISDDDETVTLTDPRAALQEQTFTQDESSRAGSNNAVNFAAGRGWYIDLPDSGERVAIDMRLLSGGLIFASVVPSNTVCSPGGYGWLNILNYETGGYIDLSVSVGKMYSSPIVGISPIAIGGSIKLIITLADGSNPTPPDGPPTKDAGTFVGKRVMWRELIQ